MDRKADVRENDSTKLRFGMFESETGVCRTLGLLLQTNPRERSEPLARSCNGGDKFCFDACTLVDLTTLR